MYSERCETEKKLSLWQLVPSTLFATVQLFARYQRPIVLCEIIPTRYSAAILFQHASFASVSRRSFCFMSWNLLRKAAVMLSYDAYVALQLGIM